MPTQSLPQPSAPESSAKPAQPSADAPPSGPDAAAKPVRGGTLFHLLVERGWDPRLAYTADQRIHAMTSEIAAAGLKPVLAELQQIRESMADFATRKELQTELRQIRESMAGFATRKELQTELRQIRESMAGFATKKELQTELRQIRESMVTKTDLAGFVTREDLKATLADFATKTDLRREMAERETRLIKWVFGALLAQTAVIVGLVTLLK